MRQHGQGSFEYMMSYGWAVLVIVVLAVVLWNIGVFNPNNVTQAAGFSMLRPVSWNFVGGNSQSTYATIVISNIGGVDLRVGMNGTNDRNTLKFRKPGGLNCGFINQPIGARNDVGEEVSVMENRDNGIWTVDVRAGSQVVINGTIVGAMPDYTCGGTSGVAYMYQIEYQYSVDQYNIQHTDSGSISGEYQ